MRYDITSYLHILKQRISAERDNSLKKLRTPCSFILILCLIEIKTTQTIFYHTSILLLVTYSFNSCAIVILDLMNFLKQLNITEPIMKIRSANLRRERSIKHVLSFKTMANNMKILLSQ